jgi:outer membrane cobalamin receptor
MLRAAEDRGDTRAGTAAASPSEPAEGSYRLPPLTVWSSPFSAKSAASSNGGILISADALNRAPQRTLDNILRDTPGFRLFRRTDSIAAHPTTQGVSLGNVGPNGASRSVLLVDGVPFNDPFGGWIGWNRFLPSTLSSVRMIPGGGVSPWGTASLGGVIAMDSRVLTDAPFAQIEAAAGDRLRHQAGLSFATDLQNARTRIFGTVHESDFRGYRVVSETTRGPVDIRADSMQQSFDAGLRHAFSEARDWQLTLRAQGSRESRGNGTPLATNSGEALDFSMRLTREVSPQDWAAETIVFAQKRDLESLFTSVAANRQSETPTLDQFAVPSNQWGWIQRFRIPLGETHQLRSGVELTAREGVTRERFSYSGGAFTKQREAGGRQSSAAFFLHDTWRPNPEFEIEAGARMDVQRDHSGSLREWTISDGSTTARREFSEKTHINPQLSLALKWVPSKTVETTASTYFGVRNATLNELYRPFRVRNDITIGNAGLEPEKNLGADWALQYRPVDQTRFRIRAFANQMTDAIANLTIVQGPGTYADWGSIPAGGAGLRRENIDRASVCGIEFGVEQDLPYGLTLNAGWLCTRSRVERCTVQPGLEGRLLPQVPTHQGNLRVSGEHGSWQWNTTLRYAGGQFDDDANQYRLSSYVSLDARLSKRIGKHSDIFVSVENAFDREIQTRLDATGATGVGAPRMCTAGFRRSF